MLLRRQAGLFKNALLGFDVAVSAFAFLATFFLRQSIARVAKFHPELLPSWLQGVDFPLVTQFRAYQLLFYAMPAVWAFALYISGTTDFRSTYKQMTIRYARAVGIGLALFVSLAFVFKMHAFARSFVVLFGAINLGALVTGRYAIMEIVAFMRHKRVDGHRMVIVGCNEQSVQFANSLRQQRTINI